MDWIEEANKYDELESEIYSFNDYMNMFEENPAKECRPSYQYLLDMLEHFGKDEEGRYHIFEKSHLDSPAVHGQHKPEKAFVKNLKNFQEEGFNNKFILLVGPNGSSKSSIVKKIMKGAEEYSRTKEGALFTFSWIFPIDQYVKGSLGLNAISEQRELASFAHLEDKDISAILNSELKDHPLLLIPIEYRQKLIDEKLHDYPQLYDSIKKSYLYRGDLSKRNRMIYDALLKNYKGKHQDVLKHIRIERHTISKRYSKSAVTIEPQIHVDARMQQITMDKRLASLPPSLQSLNLFSLQGEIVLANRGILEFSDLLKRPLDAYKYLLMTMESGTINLQGILTELDILFIGTSNEIHLAAFKQHPDYNSFKGRFTFVRVPYLLNFRDEEKIYQDQIKGLDDMVKFEPFCLRALCLFAVMTRLRACQSKNYPNKKLATIVTSLTPLEKTTLLTERKIPERLDSESSQILHHSIDQIEKEFENENLYEGKFGISPRDLKNIIYDLASHHKYITFIEVLEYLQNLILKKNEYDFLNMTPQGDYHNPPRFLALIKNYGLDIFDKELRDSLGLVDDRSYEDYIQRYIQNINSQIKGEKIKNPITGKFENSDEYFIKEFESNISLKEDAKNFRSHVISRLGAYYLDNKGSSIVYKEVFPDLVKRLKESFRNEQKKVIQNISKNIVFYEAEANAKEKGETLKHAPPISKDVRGQIDKIIQNLTEKYEYSPRGALSILKFIIKERY